MVQIAILSKPFVKKYASSFCEVIPHNRVLLEHFLYHFQPLALEVLGAGLLIDLLQALASKQAFFGHEAADRERRSRERSTCLAWRVAICISRQKWGVAWLAFGVSGFICESLTSMTECPDSTPTKSTERVCLPPSSKAQICFLCAKVVSNNDFRRKLTTSGGR